MATRWNGIKKPSEDNLEALIKKVSERMYFLEELMDLFAGNFIDNERFLQLRKLFKSEEREFAIKIVKELHDKHITA